jgi:glycosyltransferase involved in cell wall biosynthesis
MPAHSASAPSPPPLRLAIEATSLLGARTGVGTMTRAVLDRVAARPEMHTTALLVSWRGRGALAAELPAGTARRALVFPARLAHLAWQRFDHPAVRGFEVVHGTNFVVPPAPGAAELVTVHDLGPWRFPDLVDHHSLAYPRLLERAVDRGAHVHVVSRFVADEVAGLGVAAERIHVVRNGFDAGGSGDPDRGRILAGGRYVLALGTVEPRKDLPTLVRAMPVVWAEHPDLRLVHVGSDGWGIDAFEAAVADLDPVRRERLVRLGYVSDETRSDLLAGAEVLAFPSIYEGFGLPPLEAMARATPVVTTTAGALPEVCGDAALLVEPGDAGALAEAIVTAVGDERERGRLIGAGLARARSFSWSTTADELVALYRDLAGRPG